LQCCRDNVRIACYLVSMNALFIWEIITACVHARI